MFKKKSRNSVSSLENVEFVTPQTSRSSWQATAKGKFMRKSKSQKTLKIELLDSELSRIKSDNELIAIHKDTLEKKTKDLCDETFSIDTQISSASHQLKALTVDIRNSLSSLRQAELPVEMEDESGGDCQSKLASQMKYLASLSEELEDYAKEVMARREIFASGEWTSKEATNLEKTDAQEQNGDLPQTTESNTPDDSSPCVDPATTEAKVTAADDATGEEAQNEPVAEEFNQNPELHDDDLPSYAPLEDEDSLGEPQLERTGTDPHLLAPNDLIFRVQSLEARLLQLQEERATLTKEIKVAGNYAELLSEELEEYKEEIAHLKEWIQRSRRTVTVVIDRIRKGL